MRGQLEEARHTVLRAGELEAQRRAAADAFERDARDRGLGRRRTTEARLGTTEATPDPRGVPTREQLETRERELREMRARLDELDAAGRDLSRLVGEMREVMDGRRQDPEACPRANSLTSASANWKARAGGWTRETRRRRVWRVTSKR